MNPAVIVAGFIIGALTGMTGVGAAALTTPFLILFVGARPITAVGTDFVYAAATKLLGTQRHWKQGTVDARVVLRLAAASVPGLLVGTVILHATGRGHTTDAIITHVLGVAILLAAVSLALQTVLPEKAQRWHKRGSWRWRYVLPLAFLLGILVGVTSIGSGSLFFVLFSLAVVMPLPCIVGTDVAHAALLTAAGALINLGARTADLGLTANLLVGSLPGVWIGSAMTKRVPRRTLSGTLAVVLAVTGVRYII